MAPGCVCHRSQAVIKCCRFCPGGCLVTGQSPCSCLYRDICRAAAYNRWRIILYYYIKCAGGCIAFPSVKVYVTAVVPTGNVAPGAWLLVVYVIGPRQLSSAVGSVQVAVWLQVSLPAPVCTVISVGQPLMTGGVLSCTITLNVQVDVLLVSICKGICHCCCPYRERCSRCMAPGCVCHRSQAVIKCCRFCPCGCLVTGQSPCSCLYRDICRAAAYDRWRIVLYYYIKCAGGCIQ